MTQRVLVAGSSGGIGAELARQLRAAGYTVFTLSRSGTPSDFHCVADLSSPDAIATVQSFLQQVKPDVVFCCAGVLHNETHGPEKNLSQLQDDWLLQSMQANVLPH